MFHTSTLSSLPKKPGFQAPNKKPHKQFITIFGSSQKSVLPDKTYRLPVQARIRHNRYAFIPIQFDTQLLSLRNALPAGIISKMKFW